MEDNRICSMQDVSVTGKEGILLRNIELNINRGNLITIISKDGSGSSILKVLAGLKSIKEGSIEYIFDVETPKGIMRHVQYVPDDIICYSNMRVKELIQGFLYTDRGQETVQEAIRLCDLFGINMEEQLLDMTFEHNRLVAMIQAIAMQPDLLLLDMPYDLLSDGVYGILLKELVHLRMKGTAIVLVADAYHKVVIPCDRYYFLKDGVIYAEYRAKELPHPAKVITLDGGVLKYMVHSKMKVLYRTKKRCCILYREQDVSELIARIYLSGCHNFSVNELTMEEEIFEEYERWMP